jgi:protein-S-isoprenylcysteine O-methyltransferase Ste14
MTPRASLAAIFEGQWLHALFLVVAGGGTLAATRCGQVFGGELRGIAAAEWFLIALAVPVAHQVFIWLCWRLELHGKVLSRRLGSAAFEVYVALFFLFGVLRVVTAWALAAADRDSLAAPRPLLDGLALVLAIPFAYLVYSVGRYFGFRRAAGLDHFDPAVRTKGLVRRGIFRFSRNAMYTWGFLAYWIAAFAYASRAALVLAAFCHAYIWVHYFATERPDLRRIYRISPAAAGGAAPRADRRP